MRNAKYYGEQAAAKLAEAKKIHAFAEEQNREITPEEQASIDAIISEVEKLKGLQSQTEKLDVVESSLKQSAGRISNFNALDVEPIHKDLKRYSVLRALRNQLEFGRQVGLEAEVSAEIAKKSGKNPQGFFMPLQYGNLDLTNGAGALDETVKHDSFIELLRKKMLGSSLGVTMLSDLSGVIQVPKQTGGATAYWISADGSSTITASNQTIGQVPLSPTTCGAHTKYTRAFMRQTSMDAEKFVIDDLTACLAHELDRVIFNGSGSGAEPEGVLQNSSVSTVSIGDGTAYPTFAKFVELETVVASGNADVGNLAYVTTPAGRGKLKSTEIASNTARFVWENDSINGYKAYASNQLPSNLTKGAYGTGLSAAIFGNWSDVLVGMWGGLDVNVNPYSADTAGAVQITVLQELDVALRHPESFAKCVDVRTN